MKSFNVMGDCVSRDILQFVGGVKVLQYHAFSSPVSICSGKSNNIMSLEDLNQNIGKEYSGFVKRCIMFDFNKSVMDYIFGKKSDYFVLDILDARHPLLINGNHCITLTNRMRKIMPLIPQHYRLTEYQEWSPFLNVSMEQWKECIGRIAGEICRHYTVNQIILNVHYGVTQYVSETGIKNFSTSTTDNVRQYNALVKELFRMLRTELDGCHVVDFPDHTMAITGHRWGLAPLHYHDIYYDYGAEAIEVILRELPYEEERAQLERLKADCSAKFELLKTKKKLEAAQRKLKWFRNALDFAEAHASDLYGDEKFSRWLSKCKKNNYRVVVLKCECAAGRILLNGLRKYSIDIAFSTKDEDFSKMSEEQFALCREADVVISANVHSNMLPDREGIRAISVYDVLK